MMKKIYIAPDMEIVKIAPQRMLALSVVGDTEVTDDNKEFWEQYSNKFQGGFPWSDEEE